MNEPQPSSSDPIPPAAPPPKKGPASALPLALVGLLIAAAGGYYAYVRLTEGRVEPVDEVKTLRGFLTHLESYRQLAPTYTDADGDLVADAPKDPGQLLRPDELTFSAVATDEPEKAEAVWKDFLAHLGKVTGKKVRYLAEVRTTTGQLEAVRDGKLHVTAFNTGLVPAAVNTAGFVPLVTPADAHGKFSYEMEVLVPAASPARSPADLKGRTIAFTAMSSTSGARAPLTVLKDEFKMLPGRDYHYVFTGEHSASIRELAAGRHEAVCVANDLLARAVAAGEIKPEQFRSIHKSQSLPPLCFGIPHRLHPDLAAAVQEAFATFPFAGTSVGEAYQAQGRVKFAPVDYKLNWASVRQIDASLARLLNEM